jgi:hypothetical protein
MGSVRRRAGALGFLLFGCGGISQPGSSTSGGTDAVEVPEVGDACVPFPPLLRIAPTWESVFVSGASQVPGRLFEFSPDGSRLAARAGLHLLEQAEYSVVDGSVVAAGLPGAEARDDAWRRELRAEVSYYPEYTNVVVDRASGERLWARPAHSAGLAALSDDGAYVLSVTCEESTSIERQDLATGVVTRVALGTGTEACSYAAPLVEITRSGAIALVAHASETVTVVDFERGTATEHVLYDAPLAGNALLALELSPSQTMIAVTALGRPLRVLGFPSFERRLPDLTSGFTSLDCYCYPSVKSEVAWSPDERLLASQDEAGHVVIRRTCDGNLVAVLDASLPTESHAVSLAFAPDGSGIAELAITDGGHRLAYYSLSGLKP